MVLDAILDSGLPPALQVTLLHMARGAEGELYLGPLQRIADERGVCRTTVSKQVSDLKERGWLRKKGSAWQMTIPGGASKSSGESPQSTEPPSQSTESTTESTQRGLNSRCVDSGHSDESNEKGFPLFFLRFSPKKVHSTPFSPSFFSSSEKDLEPPAASPLPWIRQSDIFDSLSCKLPETHPARWDHFPGDWTFRKAKKFLEKFEDFDLLATPTKNKIENDGRRYVVSQWADTFRLLQEQDGYSRKEIEQTMTWLFQPENFWIKNSAIQSVPPLRKKTKNGDAYKFDVMYQHAHSDNGSTSTQGEDAKQRPNENHSRIRAAVQNA